MWCPPDSYKLHLAPKLLKALSDGGFDITFVKSPRPNTSEVPQWGKDLMPTIADDDHPEWYNAHDREDGMKVLDGLAASVDYVRDFLVKEEQPFDVVIGHSQGGQLAAILTLLAESDPTWLPNKYNGHMPWKLLVSLSAPNPFDNEVTLADVVKKHRKIRTPSLHVYGGEKDFTLEGSKAMRRVHFDEGNSRVFTHDKGHFGPDDDEEKCFELVNVISDMLDAM